MKTLHWYFPWATALDLYNMTGRGEKLQQLHCYHPFSDSLDMYLTKNHYENYSPKMVPIAKIWGSGSWTTWGICSCSPIVNFLKVTFYHEMVSLVIFLIKNHLNRHIKHENLLSIYENMDYFQITLFTVTCRKFQKIQQPYIKRYFYVFFSTNIVEILLKLWADASSGSGAVKAFLQGSSSPSPSPSPSPSTSLLFSIFA